MLMSIVRTMGMVLVKMIVSGATEAFFKEIFMMVAEEGVKSTKTKWDDKFFESFKKQMK